VTNALGLAREVLELAVKKGIWIATAESLTAGAISGQLAAVVGASRALLGGAVAYRDEIKTNLLSVPADLIGAETAVSAKVAERMAVGAREQFASASRLAEAEVVAISATGVAGPDSLSGIAAGTVYLGVSSRLGVRHVAARFSGQRNRVRDLTVRTALLALREELRKL